MTSSTLRIRRIALTIGLLSATMLGGMERAGARELPANEPVASAPASTRTEVKKMVIEEAERFGVPLAVAMALAKVSSDFQANARSSTGARGVMQISPETASAEHGVAAYELDNPRLNIQLGLDRLNRYHALLGDWRLAVGAYHSGVDSDGRPRPASLRFMESVMDWSARYAAQAEVWGKLELAEHDWLAPHAGSTPTIPVARYEEPPHRYPHTRLVVKRGQRQLDDFEGIEARRLAAQHWLDDFGPRSAARPRSINGAAIR